tara:strand:+ start:93 stop:404 length:312 start_codon:yes stop_codon:yes gene_type:complete
MSEVIRLNRALNRIIAKEQALLAKMAADGGDTFKNEARLEQVQAQRREANASAAEAEYEASQKKKESKGKSSSKKGGGVGSPLDLSKGDMRRYAKTLGSKPLV